MLNEIFQLSLFVFFTEIGKDENYLHEGINIPSNMDAHVLSLT